MRVQRLNGIFELWRDKAAPSSALHPLDGLCPPCTRGKTESHSMAVHGEHLHDARALRHGMPGGTLSLALQAVMPHSRAMCDKAAGLISFSNDSLL